MYSNPFYNKKSKNKTPTLEMKNNYAILVQQGGTIFGYTLNTLKLYNTVYSLSYPYLC